MPESGVRSCEHFCLKSPLHLARCGPSFYVPVEDDGTLSTALFGLQTPLGVVLVGGGVLIVVVTGKLSQSLSTLTGKKQAK